MSDAKDKDNDLDVNEYFAVYLPASATLTTIGEWLTERLPGATMGDDGVIAIARRTQAPSLVRTTLDATPAVRAEVIARAKGGNAVLRQALRPAMQRLELEAEDERTKFDDLYDLFRALFAMPGAVGVVESDADRFVEFFAGEAEDAIAAIDTGD